MYLELEKAMMETSRGERRVVSESGMVEADVLIPLKITPELPTERLL